MPMKPMEFAEAESILLGHLYQESVWQYLGTIGNAHVWAVADSTQSAFLAYVGPRGGYDYTRLPDHHIEGLMGVLRRKQRQDGQS